jgi:hypothetical protein
LRESLPGSLGSLATAPPVIPSVLACLRQVEGGMNNIWDVVISTITRKGGATYLAATMVVSGIVVSPVMLRFDITVLRKTFH